MTVAVLQNVQVNFQSALATAVTMTDITEADPGEVSYTDAGSSDPSNGDYIVFPTLSGMTRLRDRVFRVANVDTVADTFDLEGENTTGYGSFTAGTFSVVTFGTSASTFTDISVSGGAQNFAEYGFIHDDVNRQIPTDFENSVFTFTSTFELDDATLISLNSSFKSKSQLAFQLILENSNILLGFGYIAAPLNLLGSKGEVATTEVTLSPQGLITAYAS